jgi:putative FmdB family regulatory protein
MPCYQYICECGESTEKIRPFSEFDIIEVCPNCGKDMRKSIHNPLWIKADGFWYRNDYQNSSKKELEDALKENDIHRKTYDKIHDQEDKDGLI